jgi:hypothetical protein
VPLQNRTHPALANHNELYSTFVTIPNLAYRSLEAGLITLAGANGVTISSFEEIAAPLFASQGMGVLATQLPAAVKLTMGPVAFGAMYTTAVTQYAVANAVPAATAAGAIQTQWRTAEATTANGGTRDPSNLLALPADVGMTPAVANTLWNASDPISFLNANGWGL